MVAKQLLRCVSARGFLLRSGDIPGRVHFEQTLRRLAAKHGRDFRLDDDVKATWNASWVFRNRFPIFGHMLTIAKAIFGTRSHRTAAKHSRRSNPARWQTYAISPCRRVLAKARLTAWLKGSGLPPPGRFLRGPKRFTGGRSAPISASEQALSPGNPGGIHPFLPGTDFGKSDSLFQRAC